MSGLLLFSHICQTKSKTLLLFFFNTNLYLRRSHAGQWIINLLRLIDLMEDFGSQRDMETLVIEVTELHFVDTGI